MASLDEGKIIDSENVEPKVAGAESSENTPDVAKGLEESSSLSATGRSSSQAFSVTNSVGKPSKESSNLGKTSSRFGSLKNLLGVSGASKETGETNAPINVNSEESALKFENTYRMKPDKKFQSEKVQRLVDDILHKNLDKFEYDSNAVVELTKTISNEILDAVKKLEYERYKVVVDVTLGEFKGQGIRVASRCLWDMSVDSYASASFKNSSTFAVAMVFGIYFE